MCQALAKHTKCNTLSEPSIFQHSHHIIMQSQGRRIDQWDRVMEARGGGWVADGGRGASQIPNYNKIKKETQ